MTRMNGSVAPNRPSIPALPSMITKPAKTCSVMWPEERDQSHDDEHIEGGIGETDLVAAQGKERSPVVYLELMDRIDLHDPVVCVERSRRATYLSEPCRLRSLNVGLAMRPAERITLSTPAAKPSRRNTVSPQGEMPSRRSINQPMPAPTKTPATSSLERRKPLAYPDAVAVCCAPAPSEGSRPAWRVWPSPSLSRWSLAERAASSGCGLPQSTLSRASLMLSTLAGCSARGLRAP